MERTFGIDSDLTCRCRGLWADLRSVAGALRNSAIPQSSTCVEIPSLAQVERPRVASSLNEPIEMLGSNGAGGPNKQCN